MIKVNGKPTEFSNYEMQTTLIGGQELEMLREARGLLRNDKKVILGYWLNKRREGNSNH